MQGSLEEQAFRTRFSTSDEMKSQYPEEEFSVASSLYCQSDPMEADVGSMSGSEVQRECRTNSFLSSHMSPARLSQATDILRENVIKQYNAMVRSSANSLIENHQYVSERFGDSSEPI